MALINNINHSHYHYKRLIIITYNFIWIQWWEYQFSLAAHLKNRVHPSLKSGTSVTYGSILKVSIFIRARAHDWVLWNHYSYYGWAQVAAALYHYLSPLVRGDKQIFTTTKEIHDSLARRFMLWKFLYSYSNFQNLPSSRHVTVYSATNKTQ